MKNFKFVDNLNEVFYKLPVEFNMFSDKETLSYALGAVLYMSGLRENLLKDVISTNSSTVVICLEDAVSEDMVAEAEKNVIKFVKQLEENCDINPKFIDLLPLIFIRIRSYEQLRRISEDCSLKGICGFVFPKFNPIDGERLFLTLEEYRRKNDVTIYGMPILETPEIIFKEKRLQELIKIKEVTERYREFVLNIRIGGTDLSGIFGLRRSSYNSIYDLCIINDCIGDIVNIFKRDNYVISAPVYEYYDIPEDFEDSGLVKEVRLDRVNGLIGKTVIHPNQVQIVNSLLAVTKEEYLDAKAIIESSSDGVIKSPFANKMNEVKPHYLWAKNVMKLSKTMGVLNDGKSYKDILAFSNKDMHRGRHRSIIEYKQTKV